MNILLTGGAGFIGSHLAQRLLERGETLTILDNFNGFYDPRIKERNIERVRESGDFALWRKDLMDRESLETLFAERSPEAVIHLAAYAGVRPSLKRPDLYSQVNLTGTVHLLELAAQSGVGKFIFGSSSSVYGVNSKVPFSEDDSLRQPISPYAVSKRAGELMCASYHHNYGMRVACLRLFTVYGPRQRPEMAIHKFARMIAKEEEIPVYHMGESQRDYTFVDDIVEGIVQTLDTPFDFEVLNLGNSLPVKLLDLIGLLEKELGVEAKLKLLPPQRGDVPVTFADVSRARERIGYQPGTAIEEGIARFVDWFRRAQLPSGA